MSNNELNPVLLKTIDFLEKKFGKGTVINFEEGVEGIEFLPTGSMYIDFISGGGYPKGRIIEIYGPESSGKTTMAIHAMIESQKEGGAVCFIDVEHAFDPSYAENMGLDLSKGKFFFAQPTSSEEALEIASEFLKTKQIGVIVVDSVAAMVPQSELDGDFGDAKMGLQARLMSQAMRMLTGKVSESNSVLIFINQTRDQIGVMFGNPETTTGGNALKFYASQRYRVQKIGSNKGEGEELVSNNVKVETKKNKVYPPFKKCEVIIEFGVGFDKYTELINLASELEIIKKSGSWYSYGETKLGQGSLGVKKLLMDNPELYEEIYLRTSKKLKG